MRTWSPTWTQLMETPEWSGPVPIAQATPPSEPGVYVLQAYAGAKPRSLNRALGVDPFGVLLVGEGTSLARRLKALRRAMQLPDMKRSVSHRPGLEYSIGWGYDFGRAFTFASLSISYLITDSHKVLEAALLERYRWEHLDRPPLNSSNGQWRNRDRDDEGWIVLPRSLRRKQTIV